MDARVERLTALIAHDLETLGRRRQWKEYAVELHGTEDLADAMRGLYNRNIRRTLPAQFRDLDGRQSSVPLEAEGVNRMDSPPEVPKLADFIEHATRGTELHAATTGMRSEHEVFIKTSRPVGLANMADFHIGSPGCDHQQWAEDYEYLMNTDGLYAFFNGDLTENCVGFFNQRGMTTQVLSPEQQDELMYQALEALEQKHKVLAVTAGNHDHGRDSKLVGRSFISKSCQRLGIPFFHTFGVVTVLVGPTRAKAQRYTVTVSHTGLGSSMYNKCHGAGRLWQKTRTDIVFTAHLHQPAIALDVEAGHKRLLAQAGTHNTTAEYALYKYKGGGWTAWPTVVLFPDVHDFVGFLCPRMAMKLVEGHE